MDNEYLPLWCLILPRKHESETIWTERIRTKTAAASAKSLQSCLTLYNPTDGSPPSSPVPGILQARTLEWVAISVSNAGKWKMKVKLLSHVWPSATPWTAAFQAPPSMGFSRQEHWSGVPLPSPMEGQLEVINSEGNPGFWGGKLLMSSIH